VGAALSFSFAKYNDELNSKSVKKLVKRSVLIFLTGLLLNAFPFYPTSPDPQLTFAENYIEYLRNIRIFGVLQRIAMCLSCWWDSCPLAQKAEENHDRHGILIGCPLGNPWFFGGYMNHIR
jgi:hypothetical protein